MQLDKAEFDMLIELEKTGQFMTFTVGGRTVMLMTDEVFEMMQPKMIDKFKY